jgi:hypothetical protein
MRRVLTTMEVTDDGLPANLAIVTLPGDRAALCFAVELAACAASTGTLTALVVAATHPAVQELRAACTVVTRTGPEVRDHLQVHSSVTGLEAREVGAVELMITVVVDEEQLVLPTWGRRIAAAVAVSSGFATADTLAATALRWLDAGYPLGGVVVLNPEPSDLTTGQLERIRTASRGTRTPSAPPARELSPGETPTVPARAIGQAT